MAPLFLADLPAEILDSIIRHCYPEWTIYVLDRIVRGTLAVDGIPSPALLRVNHNIADLALRHERKAFSGQMVFTTSSTQWRLLQRLRSISPIRLAWVVDNIKVLVFCSPPLFTNRIPWASLPALRTIELDYCYRSANFRCHGTARELESGCLDPLIVGFARDTERFDGPLVEDAWRAATSPSSCSSQAVEEKDSVDLTKAADYSTGVGARRVEVLVIKRMNVFGLAGVGRASARDLVSAMKPESWNILVTAKHRGRIEDVRFQIVHGDHEPPFGETIIWTADEGFRETVPLAEVRERELIARRNCEREKYLNDRVMRDFSR
ncbi:hypothetical protein LTR70_004020 [Exophiala xenobiotica]|uniref:Uncharacterized protein n=1 Tax=Lithohypha guttulata TaxID=1690604 RepID=A0ABR0KEQ6_9EURO|nr:hypothetical protein LTR24_003534 [Lithohypha guttulata]KAK5321630.1 hypothetical protein LTR70_004020 [Exophiala xenobiotica]